MRPAQPPAAFFFSSMEATFIRLSWSLENLRQPLHMLGFLPYRISSSLISVSITFCALGPSR